MDIARHYGHEITIAVYMDGARPVNYAIECQECYEVIADQEMEDN